MSREKPKKIKVSVGSRIFDTVNLIFLILPQKRSPILPTALLSLLLFLVQVFFCFFHLPECLP